MQLLAPPFRTNLAMRKKWDAQLGAQPNQPKNWFVSTGLKFYHGCRESLPGDLAARVHELSIMDSALGAVIEQAKKAAARRVLLIRLRIGVLSGVVPEALEFAFEALTPGTIAEGAEMVIERVAARFWCAGCSREFEAAEMFAECPDCGSPSHELRAGREMELASMEIE
jgi:hydrogenase nickel incorporation protein HypA/HybF